jgi:hypothetical protein
MINLKNYLILLSVAITVALTGCSSDNEQNVAEEIDNSIQIDQKEKIDKSFEQAKEIFYSLPSPIETAMLMKRAGAKYNEEYLNPVSNLSNYSTTKSMALNLGIYSADLSFASMFDQSQASINYLTATKKLAEKLGILNAVENSTIKRMEGNINNRDSLMEIISETLMNSNSFLKENDRAEVAALILTGSWVEGLYIAVKIAESTENNKELVDRILDQRLSLKTLNQLLDSYKDDENVKSTIEDLKEITEIFAKVEESKTKTEAVKSEDGKTVLKSSSKATLDDESFKQLAEAVYKLRNDITAK